MKIIIELEIEGDAEKALTAIDELLDIGCLQEELAECACDGEFQVVSALARYHNPKISGTWTPASLAEAAAGPDGVVVRGDG